MIELIHGNSIEKMKQKRDNGVQVDCIITDPPYALQRPGNTNSDSIGVGGWMGQVGKTNDVIGFDTNIQFKDYFHLLYDILKDNRYIFIMVNDFNLIEALNEFKNVGFHFTKLLVWKKPNKVVSPFFMQNKEYIIFGRKGSTPRIREKGVVGLIDVRDENGDKITDVISTAKIDNKVHNSQKPVELMSYLIKTATLKDWVVMDPFMGSGSTGIAAIQNDRDFIGIEIDQNYFDISVNRIEKEKNKRNIKNSI